MRVTCLLFVVLLLPCVVSAQVVEDRIALESLGWGRIAIQPIDADGDATTDEWLVKSLSGVWRYRVVAVRQSRLCIGEWFSPSITTFTILEREVVEKRMGKDKLILTLQQMARVGETPQRDVLVIALAVPSCH